MQLTIEGIEEVLRVVRSEGETTLDLRSVRDADPFGLALLDLLIRHQEEEGARLTVLRPVHPPVIQWMQAMGLFTRPGLRTPAPDVTDALQPITPIENEDAIMALVDRFDERLAERYTLDDSPRFSLIRFMIELFQNIPQHSNATGEAEDPHGIAAMHDFADGVVLAIADKGVGMRKSLSLRGEPFETDADALDAIVLQGLSRFVDPGRGAELLRILKMIRSWDGTLAIRTGSALFHHDPTRGGDIYDVAPFPGVQIALVIPHRVFGIEEIQGERDAPLDVEGEAWFNGADE